MSSLFNLPARAILLLAAVAALHAETGYHSWLRYAELNSPALEQYRETVPPAVATLTGSVLAASARDEWIRGIRGMLGRTPRAETAVPQENAIVLATLDDLRRAAPQWRLDAALPAPLPTDAYWLKTVISGRLRYTVVAASNPRGRTLRRVRPAAQNRSGRPHRQPR